MKTEKSISAGITNDTPIRIGIFPCCRGLFSVFILMLISYLDYAPGVNQVATPSCNLVDTPEAFMSPRNMLWIP